MEPIEEPAHPPGFADSVRALGATLLDMVSTRVELAVVELREAGEHRKEMLVLVVVGALFASLGLLLAALFVVVIFWDTYRIAAAGGVTALYLAIAAGAFLRVRAKSRDAKPPFEATLRELAADRDLLRGTDERTEGETGSGDEQAR